MSEDRKKPEEDYYIYSRSISRFTSPLAVDFRQKMIDKFVRMSGITEQDTVVDVGVTDDQDFSESNLFEKVYPHKHRITAVGLVDASFLERQYPGLRFVKSDGKSMPFDSGSFDYAFANAVIEHVGSHENQIEFLRELLRVTRKGVYITTPNRWFPFEFHVNLPFIQWLPPPVFRALLNKIGRGHYADEANLNLVTRGQMLAICDAAMSPGWTKNVGFGHFLGMNAYVVSYLSRRSQP